MQRIGLISACLLAFTANSNHAALLHDSHSRAPDGRLTPVDQGWSVPRLAAAPEEG